LISSPDFQLLILIFDFETKVDFYFKFSISIAHANLETTDTVPDPSADLEITCELHSTSEFDSTREHPVQSVHDF
jgi:hypothetical protein